MRDTFIGHATSLLPDATTNPPPSNLTLDRRGRLGGHLRVAAVSWGPEEGFRRFRRSPFLPFLGGSGDLCQRRLAPEL
jgi:hypothetical protein